MPRGATPVYDFAPLSDNTPMVTRILRDLCRRLQRGAGGEVLPEWALSLVGEALVASGLGAPTKAGHIPDPKPALAGGVWNQTEHGLDTGAGVLSVENQELSEPSEDLVEDDDAHEQAERREEDDPERFPDDGKHLPGAADGTASDIKLANGGGSPIPSPVPPPGQTTFDAEAPRTQDVSLGGPEQQARAEKAMSEGADFI